VTGRECMGWLTDLLQGLPVNPVLRERLALAEQKFKDMEAENKRLKEEVATLAEENEGLKQQIERAPVASAPPKETPRIMYGLYSLGGDMSTPYCPRCYERQGKKHVMAGVSHLGHKCTVCGNIIYR